MCPPQRAPSSLAMCQHPPPQPVRPMSGSAAASEWLGIGGCRQPQVTLKKSGHSAVKNIESILSLKSWFAPEQWSPHKRLRKKVRMFVVFSGVYPATDAGMVVPAGLHCERGEYATVSAARVPEAHPTNTVVGSTCRALWVPWLINARLCIWRCAIEYDAQILICKFLCVNTKFQWGIPCEKTRSVVLFCSCGLSIVALLTRSFCIKKPISTCGATWNINQFRAVRLLTTSAGEIVSTFQLRWTLQVSVLIPDDYLAWMFFQLDTSWKNMSVRTRVCETCWNRPLILGRAKSFELKKRGCAKFTAAFRRYWIHIDHKRRK